MRDVEYKPSLNATACLTGVYIVISQIFFSYLDFKEN